VAILPNRHRCIYAQPALPDLHSLPFRRAAPPPAKHAASRAVALHVPRWRTAGPRVAPACASSPLANSLPQIAQPQLHSSTGGKTAASTPDMQLPHAHSLPVLFFFSVCLCNLLGIIDIPPMQQVMGNRARAAGSRGVQPGLFKRCPPNSCRLKAGPVAPARPVPAPCMSSPQSAPCACPAHSIEQPKLMPVGDK
jgi:hypothetical protein